MVHESTKPEFFVVNGPGPYQLLKDYMSMFDERRKLLVDVVVEYDEGWKSSLQFEAALIGPAPNPENVRLLGRFRSKPDLFGLEQPLSRGLNEWRWEVLYCANRSGLVFRLSETLPEKWTS